MLRDLHAVLALLEGGFSNLRILVVGDLMLDRYILGDVDRVSPEAPVPVLRHAQRYERAGGAANVAMNLAGLGCKAFLAGFWGEDVERDQLAEFLEGAGVDTVGMVTTDQPTISKTRIVGRNQQLLRLDIESKDRPTEADGQSLTRAAVALVSKVHAVVLSDYAKGALTPSLCEAVIREAREKNVPVLADPKTPDFSKYSGASVVCPNLNELSLATGIVVHDLESLIVAGEAQRLEHGLGYLAVTMSEKGIRVLCDEGPFHSPARARRSLTSLAQAIR